MFFNRYGCPLHNQVEPDIVVNSIGIEKRRPEVSKTPLRITINSAFTHHPSQLRAERYLRPINSSTDCVFFGDKRRYAGAELRMLRTSEAVASSGRSL